MQEAGGRMQGTGGGQEGKTLVIALLALAIGTMLVTGLLYYVSTSQQAVNAAREQTTSRYSADAGVEHALWRVANQSAFRQTLVLSGTQFYTQVVNATTVAISVTQTITDPGSGGGSGGSQPVYAVRVEPNQAAFVLPSGSSYTYDLFVINAGRVDDTFVTSMTLRFDTQSGNVRWSVVVRKGSGAPLYSLGNFGPPKGVYTITTGVFDTTPLLAPGESEQYYVTVTKGVQGGKRDTLSVGFTACSVGAASQSPPQVVCGISWLYTNVESQNTPAISMDKIATPFTVVPGDYVTYTVICQNTGDGTADTIQIMDMLPGKTEAAFVVGSTSVTAGTVGYSNDGGATWGYVPVPDSMGLDSNVNAMRWTLTNIAPGISHTLAFAMRVNDPYTSTATLVRNEAQATWWKGGGQYGPTSATFNNPVTLPPVYRITSTAANTTIVAYARLVRGKVRILSWEFLP